MKLYFDFSPRIDLSYSLITYEAEVPCKLKEIKRRKDKRTDDERKIWTGN